MAEENDSGLLREIDEELRQEQFTGIAKQYGKYAIAVVVLIVAGVGGFKGWESYDRGARENVTRQYVAALSKEQSDDTAAALDGYAALATGGGDVAILAQMRQARLLADAGDAASARTIYESISADTSLDQQYRDLASLYAAVHALDGGAPQEALSRLTPLLDDANPWRHSARETAALAHLESGDVTAARTLLEQLSADPASPEGIRSRSRQLLDSIGAS